MPLASGYGLHDLRSHVSIHFPVLMCDEFGSMKLHRDLKGEVGTATQ